MSPKVVDLFDRVRAKIAGILTLLVDPPKAHVLVDGEPVEPQEGGKVPLLSGSRTLRIEMDGYDPYEEMFAVVAGAETRKEVRLRPNRRVLQFVTVPAGVAVSIDGKPYGTSAGPPTPESQEMARQVRAYARRVALLDGSNGVAERYWSAVAS